MPNTATRRLSTSSRRSPGWVGRPSRPSPTWAAWPSSRLGRCSSALDRSGPRQAGRFFGRTGLDARAGPAAGGAGPRRDRLVPLDAGVFRRHVRRRDRGGRRRRPDPQRRPADGRPDAGRPDRRADHPRAPRPGRAAGTPPATRAGSPTGPPRAGPRRGTARPEGRRPAVAASGWPRHGRRAGPGALGRRRSGIARRLAGRPDDAGRLDAQLLLHVLEMLWLRDIVGLVVKGTALRPLRGPLRLPRGAPRRRPATGLDRGRRRPPAARPASSARGDPGRQQRLVPPGLPRRAGVRPDGAGAAEPPDDREPIVGPIAAGRRQAPWGGNPDEWSSLEARGLVGLVVVAALAGLLGLLGLAGGGPGFLASRRTIDVDLPRRPGHPRRQPGADRRDRRRPGRRHRPDRGRGVAPRAGPDRPARRPGQEAAAGRQGDDPVEPDRPEPGQHRLVGPVGAWRSSPARSSRGSSRRSSTRSSSRSGSGPVERSHLSHTIAEVRKTVDAAGPRVRADPRHAPGDAGGPPRVGRHDPARPSRRPPAHVEDLSRRIAAAAPKIEADPRPGSTP